MTFTYVSNRVQIAYHPTRAALAEYTRYGNRWRFDGWLWDGEVLSIETARLLTADYPPVRWDMAA